MVTKTVPRTPLEGQHLFASWLQIFHLLIFFLSLFIITFNFNQIRIDVLLAGLKVPSGEIKASRFSSWLANISLCRTLHTFAIPLHTKLSVLPASSMFMLIATIYCHDVISSCVLVHHGSSKDCCCPAPHAKSKLSPWK